MNKLITDKLTFPYFHWQIPALTTLWTGFNPTPRGSAFSDIETEKILTARALIIDVD
jgi:hypothetical protein